MLNSDGSVKHPGLDNHAMGEESEQSKIFPNTAFGYWKVTVERPLRLKGIDANRAYAPKEIKAIKESAERDEAAAPVIAKIHKRGAKPDPLRGLFEVVVPSPSGRGAGGEGQRCIVEYEPDGDLRDTEQYLCSSRAASKPSSAARCSPTRPMSGSMCRASKPATTLASRAISTSRNRYAHRGKYAQTSWRLRRKPWDCSVRSSGAALDDPSPQTLS